MADDPRNEPAATPRRTTLQVVYANTAGIQGGPFDCAIDFGYQSLTDRETVEGFPETTETTETNWSVRVAMSWEHARSMHDLLGKQIEAFEKAAGNLPNTDKLRGGDPDDDDD